MFFFMFSLALTLGILSLEGVVPVVLRECVPLLTS